MKKLLYIFIALLVLPISFSCVKEGENEKTKNYIVTGDKIPRFELAEGPYGSLSSEDFIGDPENPNEPGRPGLIVFFASYCPDCTELLPEIQKVWDELGDDPDYIIAPVSRVSGWETKESVAEYWKKEKAWLTMPYYLDMDAALFLRFGNQTIPRVYITDSQGIVRWMSVGDSKLSHTFLISKIKEQN